MTTILGLGTYPTVLPRHGGQKRVAAFRDHYRSVGIDYVPVCVYEPGAYDPSLAGPDDLPLTYGDHRRGPFAVGDILCGEYAAQVPDIYARFRRLIDRLQPAAVQLEQPFMWPLVARLRRDGALRGSTLIYSSHNWEAPLREAILEKAGVPTSLRRAIAADIAAMESEICAAADSIVAVSASDAELYRGLIGRNTRLAIVPNGTDRRTPPPDYGELPCVKTFAGVSPLLFVGSAHPPNIHGFNELVLAEGLPPGPAEKFLAICGGVCAGIANSEAFRTSAAELSRHVHFFDPISDAELAALQHVARGTLLPIRFGGGSNLKTSEALVLGKWVVTTSLALRGFEAFRSGTGVLVADTPGEFREAIALALAEPPPTLGDDERERRAALYWDRCFLDSGYRPF